MDKETEVLIAKLMEEDENFMQAQDMQNKDHNMLDDKRKADEYKSDTLFNDYDH